MGSPNRPNGHIEKPCEICDVKIDAREETIHFQKFHAADTERKGEIVWLTPHHAVYGGRHYKPAAPR